MELMQETGIVRFRHLWKKDLLLKATNDSDSKTGRIALNASRSDLVAAYNTIIAKMEAVGQHPSLVAKYFYLLGRVRYVEGNYVEARKLFGQANMVIMQEGLPQNHETYYWFAVMLEIDGKIENAKMYYESALQHFSGDTDLISKDEIQKAINKLN